MTDNVRLQLNEAGQGAFFILDGEDHLGEMVISIAGGNLTVYHTEVSPKAEGKGLAKKLLAAMVDHARENSLKVIPLCPFVHAQFKRHPEMYADIWHKAGSEKSAT
ncbi:MAG: N-acetyltransferase [Bacteroidota bacterium]|nr:N-acetyltransferase [Bacteroidota bacterium]